MSFRGDILLSEDFSFLDRYCFIMAKKFIDNECDLTTALIKIKIQKSGLRQQRWLIVLLILLLSLLNDYNTGPFQIIRFGAMAKSIIPDIVTRKY